MRKKKKKNKYKKKGILNLAHKQGLLFEKSKDLISLKKCIVKMEKVKLVKVLKKYPKLKKVMNLNSFNVEIC